MTHATYVQLADGRILDLAEERVPAGACVVNAWTAPKHFPPRPFESTGRARRMSDKERTT